MWSEDASNFFFNLSMEKELKMDVIESDGKTSHSSLSYDFFTCFVSV